MLGNLGNNLHKVQVTYGAHMHIAGHTCTTLIQSSTLNYVHVCMIVQMHDDDEL